MNQYIDFSIIIIIAAVIAGIIYKIKQPLIIGYIIAGLLVGTILKNNFEVKQTVEMLSQVGITFLLFIIGLSLTPKIFKEVGKVSLVTGLGQIIFTSLIGFLICRYMGFDIISAVYISIALTFSSTIIILKILSDKKAINKLYGKIAIGFLLVQDVVAVIMLMIISSSAQSHINVGANIITTIFYGIILTALIMLFSIYVLSRLLDYFAKSQELLFLFTIAWGLAISTLFYKIGFSIEIGALIGGVALASSKYQLEVSSKMKSLRDFFIILFFILLGSQLAVNGISQVIMPAIYFSLFVLIGNPLIVIILMTQLKYTAKNAFLAGLTVAQISEFSLILIILGIRVGHIDSSILPLVTLVAIITITFSTYAMIYSEKLYLLCEPIIKIFEKKHVRSEISKKDNKHDLVIFGCNRLGIDFLHTAVKNKIKYLVIDYNPEVIKNLELEGFNSLYADAEDQEVLENLHLNQTKMVISTIPDYEVNTALISKIKKINKKIILIVIAHNSEEAVKYYDQKADYVITPHFLGSRYTSGLIAKYGFDQRKFDEEKDKHLNNLLSHQKKIYNSLKSVKEI